MGFTVKLVTVGCPCVGDSGFVQYYSSLQIPTVRYIHSFDLVVHLPLGAVSERANARGSGILQSLLRRVLPQDLPAGSQYHHVCLSTILDSADCLVQDASAGLSKQPAAKVLETVMSYHSAQLYLSSIHTLNQPMWISLASVAWKAYNAQNSLSAYPAAPVGELQLGTGRDPAHTAVQNARAGCGLASSLCSLLGVAGIGTTVVCTSCAVMLKHIAQLQEALVVQLHEQHQMLDSSIESAVSELGAKMGDIGNDIADVKRRMANLPKLLDEKLLQSNIVHWRRQWSNVQPIVVRHA